MKLTTEKKPLVEALSAAAKVAQAKTTIPILSHVKLFAGDMLSIKATDLDIETTSLVAAEIDTQGETTVHAATLLNIAKKAPNGALIAMDVKEDQLHVSFGRSHFQIATLPADDFPVMASEEYAATFTIPSERMARVFDKAHFAASDDETRYYLQGVYLHHVDGHMRGVATNGHILAQADDATDAEFPSVIVPSKTINALTLGDGDVEVSVSDGKIRFATDNATIVSKVIDGTFPDYTRVIPQSNDNRVELSGAALKQAVDRVAAVMERGGGVRFTLDGEGLVVQGRGGANSADDFVEASYDCDLVEIGFSPKYINATMQRIEGDAILMLGGSMDPALLHDTADSDWLAVVMPMRV